MATTVQPTPGAATPEAGEQAPGEAAGRIPRFRTLEGPYRATVLHDVRGAVRPQHPEGRRILRGKDVFQVFQDGWPLLVKAFERAGGDVHRACADPEVRAHMLALTFTRLLCVEAEYAAMRQEAEDDFGRDEEWALRHEEQAAADEDDQGGD